MVGDVALRAVVYTRVSDDRENRDRSVSEQEYECLDFCAERGWQVVRIFSDPKVSASRYSTKARPGFAEMMGFVAGGGADVIVCWENSRGTRRLREWVAFRELCEKTGVLFSYSGRVYDMRDADDRQRATEDAVRSEGESEATRKRVLRTVRANARQGRPHGRHLFGYRREYDPVTRKLVRVVEVPEQAAVVREMGRRLLAGETCRGVAADFNGRGVPPPGRTAWTLEMVKRMAINPAYAGQRVHQGQVIGDADWPPIWHEDRAEAALISRALRMRLTDPARRTVRDGAVKHLLSGIAECGSCEAPLGVINNRGTISYVCKVKFDVTRKIGVWQPDGGPLTGVDDLVVRVLLAWLRRPDSLELLRPPAGDGAKEAEAEARRLRGELDEAEQACAAGRIRISALERITAELTPQIEQAELAAAPRPLPQVVAELAAAEDIAGMWQAMSIPQRRETVRTVMRIRVLPTRRGIRFDGSGLEVGWRTGGGEVVWDRLDPAATE